MHEKTIPLTDIYTIFSSSKPTLYKAIVDLIFTSKMTPTTLSELKLNDFLEACMEYFDKHEEKTLKNLLKKDPWKIIPTWNIKSKNIITFNTPETTFYIFLYLKEKRIEDLNHPDQPLFKSGKNNFLPSNKISAYVSDFNKLLKIFNDNYANQFYSKNLINTYIEIYEKHMSIEPENKENFLKLIDGKLSKNSKFYRRAIKNPDEIKNYYKMLIPYLTARTDINYINFKPDYSNKNYEIIKDYYNTKIKDNENLDYGQEQLLLKFAEDLSEHEADLNKLFKKSLIELKLHNYDFKKDILSLYGMYIEKTPYPSDYALKIGNTMDNLKLYDLIKINKFECDMKIIEYIVKHEYYNKDITPTKAKELIEEILFQIIDEK